jgi:hypothetical protein
VRSRGYSANERAELIAKVATWGPRDLVDDLLDTDADLHRVPTAQDSERLEIVRAEILRRLVAHDDPIGRGFPVIAMESSMEHGLRADVRRIT